MRSKIFRKAPIAFAVSAALLQSAAFAYESPVHTFSINDVLGGFDGRTFGGTATTDADTSIICDLGNTSCPSDNLPFIDKSGVKLYPVDSEFGYYVVDFLGAQGKARDGDYLEGFVGNIVDGTSVVGIQVSNAPTLKYKVKPPLGTWCQGLGGTSVKCETEHYTVMEHVQSCHETIPYFFVEEPLLPPPATQRVLTTPDGVSLSFDCDDAPLDDNAIILVDGDPTGRLINSTPCDDVTKPEGCQMFPNDKTDMQNNIALTNDYSVQLKDDGKPLYGWGGIHKRPNDIRMYARLALPEQWKDNPNTAYTVTKAHLVVDHWITNNPNDQLRPEDLENEAATGRKPSYQISGTVGEPDEVWTSTVPCYEGDGDFIEGEAPATPIGVGTVLRNMPYALHKDATPGTEPDDDPYAFSSDLYKGLTNAYYTTINRDPFEWSYVANNAAETGHYDFVGTSTPLSVEEMEAQDLVLVSGPRWRLKPNKFGQDLPGLEIPLVECSAPPFQKDNVKYVTGEPTTTIINLLDWDEAANGPSPLSTSTGWIDYTANAFITVDDDTGVSSNGLPMSEDFDLAVYIKGDAKSTAVYNAQLILEYEGEVPEPPGPESFDLTVEISDQNAQRVVAGDESLVLATVINLGPDDLAGTAIVELTGVTNRGLEFGPLTDTVSSIESGDGATVSFPFTAPEATAWINWTVTVTAASDANDSNNTDTRRQPVRK